MQRKYILTLLLTCSSIIYIVGFLFSYDYLIIDLKSSENRLSSFRSIFEYSLMYLSFIFFVGFLFKIKYVKIISLILLLFLSINSFVSYCCYFIYDSGFNIGMAVSVLDSNINEAINMAPQYIVPILISVFLLGINVYTIILLSKIKFNNFLKLCSFVWLLLPGVFLLKHHFIGSKGGGAMVKNVFYHFKDFKGAYVLQNRMDGIKDNIVKYDYKINKEGVETIVVLIGESGRKQNMSLYGYERNTTPNQIKNKDNMYLFEYAFSPAGITNLSLPLTLSKIDPDRFDTHMEDIADNIINLGNNYNYKTYWITTQNNIKGVTEIASYSNEKKWINGYDSELLPHFKESLKHTGKKLIVLHINGSHPDPCLRYPRAYDYFNNENYLDCYDNSILYTDNVIGNILNELKAEKSAFIYFTDHGLKSNNEKLIHSDSKESSNVPFYVWFSNKELKSKYKFSKSTDTQVSISYLYPLVMNLMGLDEIKLDKIENKKYFTLDHTSINYDNLKD